MPKLAGGVLMTMEHLKRRVLLSAHGNTDKSSISEKRAMKGHDFRRWRKGLELSQKEAADALGLKRRVVQYYEKGERDGDPVKIPRTVRLACFAILSGITDYHGPDKDNKKEKKERDDEREAAKDGDKPEKKGKKKKK
jgi:transcriptional regulator with XRE-family HTH domain